MTLFNSVQRERKHGLCFIFWQPKGVNDSSVMWMQTMAVVLHGGGKTFSASPCWSIVWCGHPAGVTLQSCSMLTWLS